jgi:DNA (cytosine-5)-methyltransferase 1
MASQVSIIDLFSGPGGLGEGFASVMDGSVPAYRIEVSVEKECYPSFACLLEAVCGSSS